MSFAVLAIAAYLAFTLFRKYSSRRRRANHLVYDVDAGDTLAHRYLPSYSNRWSLVNGFPLALTAFPLIGRRLVLDTSPCRLRLLHLLLPRHYLFRQLPAREVTSARTPEVVAYVRFFFFFIVTLLTYPSSANLFPHLTLRLGLCTLSLPIPTVDLFEDLRQESLRYPQSRLSSPESFLSLFTTCISECLAMNIISSFFPTNICI